MDSPKRIAAHEAGHALVALNGTDQLCTLVDIECAKRDVHGQIGSLPISDGTKRIGGVTHFDPPLPRTTADLEPLGYTPRQLRWCLLVLAGGIAGELVAGMRRQATWKFAGAEHDFDVFRNLFPTFAMYSDNDKKCFDGDGNFPHDLLEKRFFHFVDDAKKLLKQADVNIVADALLRSSPLSASEVRTLVSL